MSSASVRRGAPPGVMDGTKPLRLLDRTAEPTTAGVSLAVKTLMAVSSTSRPHRRSCGPSLLLCQTCGAASSRFCFPGGGEPSGRSPGRCHSATPRPGLILRARAGSACTSGLPLPLLEKGAVRWTLSRAGQPLVT